MPLGLGGDAATRMVLAERLLDLVDHPFEARSVAMARMVTEEVDPAVGDVARLHQPVEPGMRIAPAEENADTGDDEGDRAQHEIAQPVGKQLDLENDEPAEEGPARMALRPDDVGVFLE